MQRLQAPTATGATRHAQVAGTNARLKEHDRLNEKRERERERERKAKHLAREKAEHRQAQLLLALEHRSVLRLQAAYRGRKGRLRADEQDRLRPGLREAVRAAERARIRAVRAKLEQEARAREQARLEEIRRKQKESWHKAKDQALLKLQEVT